MTQDKKDFIETILMWFRSPKVGNDEDLDREFLSDAYEHIAYPHWISVDEELPKEHEWILGLSLKRCYIDVYNFDSNGLIEAHDITHWMPMPEAPHHIIDANKKVDRVIGTADHIKTALDVLNKKGGEK